MSALTFDIQAAQTNLSRIVDDVAAGAVVIIEKAGQPMARLIPMSAPTTAKTLGMLHGKIEVPDDFNAPLHLKTLAPFEGS